VPSSPLTAYDDVVFDFDGTLARLDVDWAALRHAVAEEFPDVARRVASKGLGEMTALASSEGGWPARHRLSGLLRRFEQPAGRVHVAPIEVSLRAADALPRFHIISNNLTSTVRMALAEIAPEARCAHVVGFDSSLRSKPADDPFHVLSKAASLGPRVAYIGDRSSDQAFAQACGLDFFHVSDLCE
jgi:phosphoglycolate phosphatase-like HAD superfamily hydrolase